MGCGGGGGGWGGGGVSVCGLYHSTTVCTLLIIEALQDFKIKQGSNQKYVICMLVVYRC